MAIAAVSTKATAMLAAEGGIEFFDSISGRHTQYLQMLRISCQYYNLESEVVQLLQTLEDWRPDHTPVEK